MMKKLLILGTSFGVPQMIEYAKSQGIYTIVTDPFPPEQSIGKTLSDEYWMIDVLDFDALEKKCIEEGVTAVISGLGEFRLEASFEMCRRLNLPTYCTAEAWSYSRDKAKFKKLCRELGAPLPTDYYLSDALTDEEIDKVIFPVVVKPVDQCSNAGVSYCYNKEELIAAYKYARSISKNSTIIVERMIEGEEWYSSYAIADGKSSLLALNAMYSQPGEPKNCYSITTTVSDHVKHFIEEINPKLEEVLKAVGATDGYGWIQVMLDKNDNHFYIIEMGYRLDGDMIFIPYKDIFGFDVIKWMVDNACGVNHKPEELPQAQTGPFTKCGCGYMLWTNKEGKVKEVHGFEELSKIPGLTIERPPRIGSAIHKYGVLSCIEFTTDSIEKMCDMIQTINDTISIVNEKDEDVLVRYTDFDYLKDIYYKGLSEK